MNGNEALNYATNVATPGALITEHIIYTCYIPFLLFFCLGFSIPPACPAVVEAFDTFFE